MCLVPWLWWWYHECVLRSKLIKMYQNCLCPLRLTLKEQRRVKARYFTLAFPPPWGRGSASPLKATAALSCKHSLVTRIHLLLGSEILFPLVPFYFGMIISCCSSLLENAILPCLFLLTANIFINSSLLNTTQWPYLKVPSLSC